MTYHFAILSKVCVAIFVILSGIGFSETVKHKETGLFQFYLKRLTAIYSNYWFIASVFVLFGVFVMGRTLDTAFESHPYIKFLVQMTGLDRFVFRERGYNMTWWYMSVIIPLTMLFPLIYDAVNKYGLIPLVFFLVILFPEINNVWLLNVWLLPFALGIYLSQRNCIPTISERLSSYGPWRYLILLLMITATALYRIYGPVLNETKIDWLFGLLVILFVFELSISFQWIGKILGMLGGHLFNVFLFHTFIYYYFFSDFIYSFKYPVLIFLVLFVTCLAISMFLEYVKRHIGFYTYTGKIQNLKIPAWMEIPFVWNESSQK